MIRLSLSLSLFLSLLAAPVAAELEFCNETDEAASVAIGYSEDGLWTSEGWWLVEPGACTTAVAEDLTRRYYYWRAVNRNGAFEAGRYLFCVADSAFTIEGDTGCADRGHDRLPFAEVDTGEARRHTVTLGPDAAPVPMADAAPGPDASDPFRSRIETLGLFSHCDAGDCVIIADGRRVLVGSGRGQLLRLPRNTPIRFVGRFHSREGNTDRIALASFEELPLDGYSDLRAMLQGRWQALRSPSTMFDIIGGLRQDLLRGSPVFEAFFDIVPVCPLTGGGPGVEFTYYTGGSDRLCWEIRVLEPDTLVVKDASQIEEQVFLRVE